MSKQEQRPAPTTTTASVMEVLREEAQARVGRDRGKENAGTRTTKRKTPREEKFWKKARVTSIQVDEIVSGHRKNRLVVNPKMVNLRLYRESSRSSY